MSEALTDDERKLLKKMGEKGAFLAYEQGRSLKSIRQPETVEEIESLGDMGPRATACLDLYMRADELINELTGTTDNLLTRFAHTMYRGSAQRSFKRGEKLLESIGQLGAYIPAQPKRERGEAVETDWNE